MCRALLPAGFPVAMTHNVFIRHYCRKGTYSVPRNVILGTNLGLMNMKKLLGAVGFLALLAIPECAHAVDADYTVTPTGVVPTYCQITTGSVAQTWNINNFSDTVTTGGTFGSYPVGTVNCSANGVKIKITTTKGCMTPENVSCNTGMPSNNVFYYASATATFGANGSITTGEIENNATGGKTATSLESHASGSATISLTMRPKQNNVTLAEGTYTDTIAIAVGSGI